MSDSLRDQLQKIRCPKPCEVWYVSDTDVRLHADSRENKGLRPVLVIMSETLAQPSLSLFNVIPLTASAKGFGQLTFPIARGYRQTSGSFKPNDNSAALIQFYQPIERKFFKECIGKIDETTYEAIREILVTQVIGYLNGYDIAP
jgi:hypothetical protein